MKRFNLNELKKLGASYIAESIEKDCEFYKIEYADDTSVRLSDIVINDDSLNVDFDIWDGLKWSNAEIPYPFHKADNKELFSFIIEEAKTIEELKPFVSDCRDYKENETFLLQLDFCGLVDGDLELARELDVYLNDKDVQDRIKKFIIVDYLTNLKNDELSKMFIGFKSRNFIEIEKERKRKLEEENDNYEVNMIDDMPF